MSISMTQDPHVALELARAYQRDRFEDAERCRRAKAATAKRPRQRRTWTLRVVRGHRARLAKA